MDTFPVSWLASSDNCRVTGSSSGRSLPQGYIYHDPPPPPSKNDPPLFFRLPRVFPFLDHVLFSSSSSSSSVISYPAFSFHFPSSFLQSSSLPSHAFSPLFSIAMFILLYVLFLLIRFLLLFILSLFFLLHILFLFHLLDIFLFILSHILRHRHRVLHPWWDKSHRGQHPGNSDSRRRMGAGGGRK